MLHQQPKVKVKPYILTNHKIIQLEEKLQEYENLDRYLKEENVLLKECIAQLDKKVTKGQGKWAFLAKCVKKWYDEFQGAKCKVWVLKSKLAKACLGILGDLNIQATPSVEIAFLYLYHFFLQFLRYVA